ncbi:MAG: hypothetical protein ABI641_11910 [Caldimonas sp.]
MRSATFLLLLCAALVAASPTAQAMGFARSTTATTLGRPLDFAAVVRLDADESVGRECVGADVIVGDAMLPSTAVRVTLEPMADPALRSVRVTTTTPIDEPVVTVDVRVGCGSKMSRRFVSFIDPPLLNLAHAAPVDVEAMPAQRFDSRVVSVVEAARRRPAARGVVDAGSRASMSTSTRRHGRRVARHRAVGHRMAAATRLAPAPDAAGRERTPTRLATAGEPAAPAGGGARAARLRLDAPQLAPAASASAAHSAQAPEWVAPAAADASSAASAALARERERIQTLEAGLAALRNDSLATKRTVAGLQARLRQAEGERYANWLVFLLAGVSALLALLAAALWYLRPRQRRSKRWFDANAAQRAAALRGNPRPDAVEPLAVLSQPHAGESPAIWRDGPSSGLPTAPATIGGLEVTTVLGPAPIARPSAAVSAAGARTEEDAPAGDLSMEALIDLEQQAEFFVVLGQDEAAIELLGNYLRRGDGASPLPYLKLLEIHQRRGDEVAYEQVRAAFNQCFHAHAPDWSTDLHFGRALDEYPQTVARLQALWPTPLQAMQSLDALLFRRDAAADAFDFPAYRELLFLYSIARELAGHVETDFGSIDLFLPLEDAPAAASNVRAMAAGDGAPASTYSIDLDVSSWPGDVAAEDLVIRKSARLR